uniref:Ras-related and estrogen-regulated growth inhibitor-like protein n=1 Tax=Diabrotica virgifera virgifera TaxID=50390 RepID=A0A6P7G500_DIAVI
MAIYETAGVKVDHLSMVYHYLMILKPTSIEAERAFSATSYMCSSVRIRKICIDDGHELSLKYGCQFYEVSAAEHFAGVSLAFHSLLKEARSVLLLRSLPIRRRLGVNSVSKVLGNIFGKNSKGDRKKRPSLSI